VARNVDALRRPDHYQHGGHCGPSPASPIPNLGNSSDTTSIRMVAEEADLQVTKFVKPTAR